MIVTYNSGADIDGCLRSLAADPPPVDHEIIVIDNNSTDHTRERVRSFSRVRLIERTDNAGYGTAVNEAVALTNGSHLLLLNPDTVVGPGSLARLLDALAEAPGRIGVVGPRLLLPTGEPQLSARRFPAPGRVWAEVARVHRLMPASARAGGRRTEFFPPDVSGPVDWVSGACHLIPREVWDRAGGLTEKTFLGFDDLEYCWRLDRLGYSTWFCAEAEVVHGCSTAVGQRWGRARIEELAIHNFFVVAADYLSWPKRKLLIAAEIAGGLTELVVAQDGGSEALVETSTRRRRVFARLGVLCRLLVGSTQPVSRFEPPDDRGQVAGASPAPRSTSPAR